MNDTKHTEKTELSPVAQALLRRAAAMLKPDTTKDKSDDKSHS